MAKRRRKGMKPLSSFAQKKLDMFKKRGEGMENWKQYFSQVKKAQNLEHRLAKSLSPKTPYGKNPETGRKYQRSETFARALGIYQRRWKRYLKLAKKAYKQQTGKDWAR